MAPVSPAGRRPGPPRRLDPVRLPGDLGVGQLRAVRVAEGASVHERDVARVEVVLKQVHRRAGEPVLVLRHHPPAGRTIFRHRRDARDRVVVQAHPDQAVALLRGDHRQAALRGMRGVGELRDPLGPPGRVPFPAVVGADQVAVRYPALGQRRVAVRAKIKSGTDRTVPCCAPQHKRGPEDGAGDRPGGDIGREAGRVPEAAQHGMLGDHQVIRAVVGRDPRGVWLPCAGTSPQVITAACPG